MPWSSSIHILIHIVTSFVQSILLNKSLIYRNWANIPKWVATLMNIKPILHNLTTDVFGNVESLCPVTIVSLLDSNDLQSGGPWNRQWPESGFRCWKWRRSCDFHAKSHDFNIFCFGMTWHDGIYSMSCWYCWCIKACMDAERCPVL